MKSINTGGITHIRPVPSGTTEWYYGLSYEHGDLYEAEEIYKSGQQVQGRDLVLIHYPEGTIYRPLPKILGNYCGEPVYLEGKIDLLNVDFVHQKVQILQFDCRTRETGTLQELPLSEVKDCYNLALVTAPMTLTRQCVGQNEFEILWPERVRFAMGDHDSFFLREGDRLFFNRWHEEGEGVDYRYWEETVIRNLDGEIVETLPGDVQIMPNGEMWHFF